MNCFRFANAMDNTTIINTFDSEKNNIANIKTQHCQIMATITNEILRFELVIKIIILVNYIFYLLLFLVRSIPSLKPILW